MPKFSTLLTSFERPKMLENAVKSVLNNTFQDWQLIIGDSSKNTETRHLIASYGESLAASDPRIIFHQYRAWSDEEDKRKCNYAWKNNMMFKLSTGDWITYFNDDDLYAKDYYQAYVDVMEAVPDAKVIYTGQKAFKVDTETGENHELQYILPAFDIKRNMFFCVDQNCVAHKREVFNEVGGWCDEPHVRNYADAEFWYRLAMAGYLAYPTGKWTSIKSIHPGQISQMAQRTQVPA